ncbi:WD40-repeat-containing domain protein, partial [Chaetomium sp. MPI-CAGE-AT-0009]
ASLNSIIFSYNSGYLATDSRDRTVMLWDLSNGACAMCVLVLRGHEESINSAVFSHDDRYIASVSDDETVRVWELANGTCIHVLRGHRDSVHSVTFSPDSRYISSATSRSIRIWDISEANRCVQAIRVGV